MYPWLSAIGQQYARQFAQGRLHHAHLLYGPQGVGKRALAEYLSEALLCHHNESMHPCGQCKSCQLNQAGTHPDSLVLSDEGASIGVDSVRAISDFVHHSAQQGGAKCIIVPEAQRMTVAASNALLKTLEEPNAHCYLWLLSSDSATLPATILSRCAKQHVYVDDEHAVQQWLTHHAAMAMASAFAKHFISQPLLLKHWQDNDELEQIQTLYQAVSQLQNGTDGHKLVDILTQNSQYIAIFRLFVSQFLLQQSQKGASFASLQRCEQQLQRFSETLTQTSGLNITLAVSQLLRTLRREFQ